MDAIGGDKTGQVALGQELPPHVDKGHALGKGQSRHRVGVQLLVAVNASHISQPAQHAAAVRLLGDKSEIPLSVNGRQRHQHRLHAGGLQRRDGAAQLLRKLRQGRVGHNASMGCKMVHTDAENYEGIYFLTDEEVLDAAARYRRWWEGRKYPRTMWTIDPCYDEPLCGSSYMWW